jgi:hypothetical protein
MLATSSRISWFTRLRTWLVRPVKAIQRQIIRRILSLDALEERLVPVASLQVLAQALPVQHWAHLADASDSMVVVSPDLAGQVPEQEFAGANVLVLDSSRDVINQITLELSRHPGIKSVRLISHGADGTLLLGNQQFDESVLLARSEDIAAWGQFLAPGADILLYGCSVASTSVGRHFVNSLSILTGADVAASTNTTGAGADTLLEYSTGNIETSPQASQTAWDASNVQLVILPNQRIGSGFGI